MCKINKVVLYILFVLVQQTSSVVAQESRPKIDKAQRDPFGLFVPPMPKALKTIIQNPPPILPVAAPLPTAPALNVQYAGQLIKSNGERIVFALYNDNMMAMSAGTTLPHGYVVESIDRNMVRFIYPALNTTARLQIPDLPKFEQR